MQQLILVEGFGMNGDEVVPVRMEFADAFLDSPPARQSIGSDFDQTVGGRLHARLLQASHERFMQGAATSARGGRDCSNFKVRIDRTTVFRDFRKRAGIKAALAATAIRCASRSPSTRLGSRVMSPAPSRPLCVARSAPGIPGLSPNERPQTPAE